MKLSVLEIFSSPTNHGQMYAAIENGKERKEGEVLDCDPLKWEYVFLGNAVGFKFVPDM